MLALLPRLRRFAFGLTGSRDRADDLLQATYERAIGQIDKWQPGTRLDAWMYRIARNLHLNEIRAEAVRRDALPGLALQRWAALDGEREQEARMTFATVRELVAALPEDQRTVLLLVAVEGLSYKEVSELTGFAMGTIASRLARARERLSTQLTEHDLAQSPTRPGGTKDEVRQ